MQACPLRALTCRSLYALTPRLWWLGLLVLLALYTLVQATTYTAAGCSQAQIQACHDGSAPCVGMTDGDTLAVPAGTCTWTTNDGLAITKDIVLQGAGKTLTVITDNISRSVDGPAVLMTIALGSGATHFRLTGFAFHDSGTTNPSTDGAIKLSGATKAWRIDHNDWTLNNTALYVTGDTYGVFDHNSVTQPGKEIIAVRHDAWGGVGAYGDNSWADTPNFGTNQFIFLEQNIINTGGVGLNDCVAGGRLVIRYNDLTNSYPSGHGTDTSGRERGCRVIEVYQNDIANHRATASVFSGETIVSGTPSCPPNFTFGTYIRSGTAAIHHNTWHCFDYGIVAQLYRDPGINQTSALWGLCTGSNPWDQNGGPETGYACLDQPGMGKGDLLSGATPSAAWPHQASEPIYEWANTWVDNGNGGNIGGGSTVTIVTGRDFIHGAMPGYTPYTYPHPLTGGSPLPPSALIRIVP